MTAGGVALLISLLTPLLWTTWRPHWLPWPIESYIDGVHNLGQPQSWLFPIFPWTAFAFAGLAVGFLLLSDWARQREAAVFAMAGAGGVGLIYLARWLDARPEQLYAVYDFWHTSPNFFLIRVGLLLAILAATYAWCRWGAGQWGFSPLIQLGQTSLLVYWVHIEFVYGRLSIVPKHAVEHSDGIVRPAGDFSGHAAAVGCAHGWKARSWTDAWRTGVPRPSAAEARRGRAEDSRTSVDARARHCAYINNTWRIAFSTSFSAMAQRWRACGFIVSVAEEIERDVEALANFASGVVKAAPDQQFGGCGNLRDALQQLRDPFGELLMFRERTARGLLRKQKINVGTKFVRGPKDLFFGIDLRARPGVTLRGFQNVRRASS